MEFTLFFSLKLLDNQNIRIILDKKENGRREKRLKLYDANIR